jgi:hypothetical protein
LAGSILISIHGFDPQRQRARVRFWAKRANVGRVGLARMRSPAKGSASAPFAEGAELAKQIS